MRMMIFASRNTKEITRDIITMIFGIAFPLVLLFLLSAINNGIPEGYGPSMFKIDQLGPGITVFGLSFMSLFSAMLIAKDRTTSFMMRLFVSPLTPAEFITGYTLPILPMAILQTLVCYAFAVILGMKFSIDIIAAVFVNIPIALVFIGLGLLFGSILNEKAVGGICGALITNLSAWFSNIWFDASMAGDGFKAAAEALPFSHAVNAARAAAAGEYGAIFPDLWWVIGYAAVILTAAIIVFTMRLRKN